MAFFPLTDCFLARNGSREGSFARMRLSLYLRNAQFRDSVQVFWGTGYERFHLHLRLADERGLAQFADRLQPTTDLFDALPLWLATPLTLSSGGLPVEAGRLSTLDTGDAQSHPVLPQVPEGLLHLIAIVGGERPEENVAASRAEEQLACVAMLCVSRFGKENVGAEAVAILHERMASVAAPGRLALALSHEADLGVGLALMRGVRALPTLEAGHHGDIVTILGRGAVLAHEALERGLGVQERAVHGELVRRQPFLLRGQIDDLVEKAAGSVSHHQALAPPNELGLLHRRHVELRVEKPAARIFSSNSSQNSLSERPEYRAISNWPLSRRSGRTTDGRLPITTGPTQRKYRQRGALPSASPVAADDPLRHAITARSNGTLRTGDRLGRASLQHKELRGASVTSRLSDRSLTSSSHFSK